MVADTQAEFFRKQLQDPENDICCDCGTKGEATWVSISHGIYLSIGAAGLHRSLGVKVSFVQSTTMDAWKPQHLRMMELGGNRRFKAFLEEQGVPADMPIREKYSTRAAKWYREDLKARADGLESLPPLPEGTGHLPADPSPSSGLRVLDQVFASIPSSEPAIRQSPVCHEAQSGVKSICDKLTSCFRQRKYSDPVVLEGEAEESAADRLVPATPLPTLLGSTQCITEKRLQLLSSGKMEGFGSAWHPDKKVVHRGAHEHVAASAA